MDKDNKRCLSHSGVQNYGNFWSERERFFYEGADRRNAFRAEQSLRDFWKRFYEDKDEC